MTAHGKQYLEKKSASFWTFSKSGIDLPKIHYYKIPQTTQKVPQKPSQNYLKNIGICDLLSLLNVQNYLKTNLKTNLKTTLKLLEYVQPPSPHILVKKNAQKNYLKTFRFGLDPAPFRKCLKGSIFFLVWFSQVWWIHTYGPWLIVQTCK